MEPTQTTGTVAASDNGLNQLIKKSVPPLSAHGKLDSPQTEFFINTMIFGTFNLKMF
jgi:hypothetical protein